MEKPRCGADQQKTSKFEGKKNRPRRSGFRLSIKPHLRRYRRARQAKSLAVVPVPSIWGFLASLNIDFFYKLKPPPKERF